MLKSKLRNISLALALVLAPTTALVALQTPVTVFAAGDATGVTADMATILKNQQTDGGWLKYYGEKSGDWAKSTIDNKATYTEIRRLAAEYIKTKDAKYSAAAIKGINFLLNMQYANGGWPQVYKGSGYHTHITFNDDAMINVMYLLDEVANKKGNFSFVDNTLAAKCKASVDKGVNCILKTQVVVNGKLTAWGQQHDENTLKPTYARAYEVPSLCTTESVTIVKFLKTRKSTPQIAASIKAATDWFAKVKIVGIKATRTKTDTVITKDPNSVIWARFYEIGTDKPIFVNRKGEVKYNISEIEQERRAGYAWYNTSPASLIK
ncbi:pectate lyase [Clostridium cellulovorans]|uniref:Pectate lyase n=2 Tax=Clostridium cellulovorans TaxID=1493 RepID=D9SKT2_CLOC7|nr:pectate lyase [Clostridium cellulovorans]ADL53504.1 pectate lyase [Clostridium cellulovorans 743B]BAV13162.1 pectate lyase [Clostridium cellulovorans]